MLTHHVFLLCIAKVVGREPQMFSHPKMASDVESVPLLEGVSRVPAALAVTIGALVTPTVFIGFVVLKSVWLTYFSLYYLWVIAPSMVCFLWAGTRAATLDSCRHGLRRSSWQLSLALPVAAVVVVTALLAYRFLAVPLGLDMVVVRERLASYGLTEANPLGDLGALAWLSFLNPIMEELFWRVFLFEALREPDASDTWSSWWVPACVTELLFASYHVPVVWQLVPLPLVGLAYVFLASLGFGLQIATDRYGLLFAIVVHFAYDLTACIIGADLIWNLGIGPAATMAIRRALASVEASVWAIQQVAL
jgi:hypothetical protein